MSILTTWLLALLLLSGCAPSHWDQDSDTDVIDSANSTQNAHKPQSDTDNNKSPPSKKPPTASTTQRFLGNGIFVKPNAPQIADKTPPAGDITLNFESTDLREVIKVILHDLLKLNYILDPAVQGTVTMDTGRPLTQDLLLPTLETLLRMNKSAMVYKGGAYYIMPMAAAIQGEITPQLGDTSQPLPQGYSLRIVPLKYIGATEMSKILKPLAPDGSIIRIDPVRNLLVIAGASPILTNLLDTIDTFDVNWMKGLSVGLFKIQHSDIKDIMKQVEGLTSGAEDNPLAGMFRVVPIEAANSLLVVTHQQEYLDLVGTWIERFDQIGEGASSDEPTLYVYRVKHGDSANLAQMLSQLFSDTKDQAGNNTQARVAPGMRSGSIGSRSTGFGSTAGSGLGSTTTNGLNQNGLGSNNGTMGAGTTGTTSGNTNNQAPVSYRLGSGVNIVADTLNNSLLLRATPAQYRQIDDVLKKLDILPLQVLVEATIVEVSLTDNLKYGLQWYFQAQQGHFAGTVSSTVADPTKGLGLTVPGFNWSLINGTKNVQSVLSAFAEDGLVKILSSPSVMVLDNHTARIQVGSKLPVLTGEQTTGTTATTTTGTAAVLYNSVTYQDVGVMLGVTPRVTPGGLVIMEIEQEVSDVAATQSTNIGSPTISTRNIQSTVAVKDGQVVVLGGLIRDTKTDSKGGIPGLYRTPGLGWLFGQTNKTSDRTELMVIITPKILHNDDDLAQVTEEFRTQMQGLRGFKSLQGLKGGFQGN